MSQPLTRRLYVPESAQVARTMLSQLKLAHRNLSAAMQKLDSLATEQAPDSNVLATARWKLGQASLSRRLLAARIREYFLSRFAGANAETLRALQAADRELLGHSAAHLAKWTAASISGDWPGYCRDAREMRRKTYALIAHEQRMLYPMLEEAADRA